MWLSTQERRGNRLLLGGGDSSRLLNAVRSAGLQMAQDEASGLSHARTRLPCHSVFHVHPQRPLGTQPQSSRQARVTWCVGLQPSRLGPASISDSQTPLVPRAETFSLSSTSRLSLLLVHGIHSRSLSHQDSRGGTRPGVTAGDRLLPSGQHRWTPLSTGSRLPFRPFSLPKQCLITVCSQPHV